MIKVTNSKDNVNIIAPQAGRFSNFWGGEYRVSWAKLLTNLDTGAIIATRTSEDYRSQ